MLAVLMGKAVDVSSDAMWASAQLSGNKKENVQSAFFIRCFGKIATIRLGVVNISIQAA